MARIKNKLKYEAYKLYKYLIEDRKAKKIKLKLYQLASRHPLIKLHIGCGPRILKTWVNIDIAYHKFDHRNHSPEYIEKFYPAEIRGDKNELICYDVTKFGIPFEDHSVDVIFHEDFLEHLSQRDQVVFLSECLRVLKKGCIHRVNTPNLLTSMRKHSDFSQGTKKIYLKEWDGYGHQNILTPDMLNEIAIMIGYGQVIFNGKDDSVCNLIPREYRPFNAGGDNEDNIFADLIK